MNKIKEIIINCLELCIKYHIFTFIFLTLLLVISLLYVSVLGIISTFLFSIVIVIVYLNIFDRSFSIIIPVYIVVLVFSYLLITDNSKRTLVSYEFLDISKDIKFIKDNRIILNYKDLENIDIRTVDETTWYKLQMKDCRPTYYTHEYMYWYNLSETKHSYGCRNDIINKKD